MATTSPPLDEIQWRDPAFIAELGGIHSNTILFYFAASPFYDRTSNNEVIWVQSRTNPNMAHLLQTREAFEGRLKTMHGLEFMVAEQPASMAPGTGTGVWVIHKQTRRRGEDGQDQVIVHSAYFVVGEDVFKAPTLADVLTYRLSTISSALSNAFQTIRSVRTWSPAHGHAYKTSSAATNPRDQRATIASKEVTPMPESQASKGTLEPKKPSQPPAFDAQLAQLAEESFAIHMRYGGEYMDENPITGAPGAFHLSSTGRKGQMPSLNTLSASLKNSAAPDMSGKKDGKADKSPKTPTGGKPRRRRSKAGTTPTAS